MSGFELNLGENEGAPSIGSDGTDLGQANPDDLANPFLAKIPEVDRNVVAKYIKDWDAGVTRRFQQIHQEYKPYKDLGVGVEDLQGAWALQSMINEDPARVYELLGQVLQQSSGETPGQQQQQAPIENEFGDELPPAFVEKFTRMEQMLEAMAGQFLQSQETQQAQEEDDALNSYLGELHDQFGDFDEDWVLSKMLKGMDGEQAVQQYGQWLQNQINERMSGKRPVPVLGGGGAVPTNGVDPRKLTSQQTQDLVAQMLANAAGQQ